MNDLNGEFLAELLSRDIKISPGISAFFNFFDGRGDRVTIVSSLEDRVRFEVNCTFERDDVAIMSSISALFDNSKSAAYIEIESKNDTVYIDSIDPQFMAATRKSPLSVIKNNLLGDMQVKFVNKILEQYVANKEYELDGEIVDFNRNRHFITNTVNGFLTSYGLQDNPKKDLLVKIVFEQHGVTLNHYNFTSKMHDVARDLKRLAPLIK